MAPSYDRTGWRLSGRLLYIVNVDWYFSLHWLARACAARDAGYEVHVATCCTDTKNFERWKNLGLTAHHIPFDKISTNPFKETVCLCKLKRLIRSLSPTLVHCVTIKPNIYGGLLGILFGIPSIKSVTGLGAVFSNPGFRFLILRKLVLLGYRLIDRLGKGTFIFENDEDRRFFKDQAVAVRQPTELIRGAGVCLDTFPFRKPTAKNGTTILFAGRLLKDKGLEMLVDAVTRARQRGISLDLEVAGILDGNAVNAISQEILDAWHRRGLVRWLGEIRDMPELIARSDVVALPTRYGEGVPRILLEAAATGRALIASDVAGCRDVVIDGVTGLLVPPDDVLALTTAIIELAGNPVKRKKMGDAGYAMVRQRFSESLVVAETLNVYAKMLSSKPR
jgi:glycosyltransferase involved in cell wall biosynthesis